MPNSILSAKNAFLLPGIFAILTTVLVACGGVEIPGGEGLAPPTLTPEEKPPPTVTVFVPPTPRPTPAFPRRTPTSLPALPATATSTPTKATTAAAASPSPRGEQTEASLPATDTPIPPTSIPPSPTPESSLVTAPPGEMITIPAGPFLMGNDEGDEDERPAHTVELPEYQIDKYEVTNAQFALFIVETGYVTDAELAGEGKTWRSYYEPGKENHPVVKVSWNDALAYCLWAGKRLPTEAEWEKAARGTDGRIYPWGNEYDPNRLNGKDGGRRTTTPVGSFPEGASPYGVMDMAGNVWEWTDDWYQAYPGNPIPSPYYGQKFKVLRGGGWFDEADLVRTTNRSASIVTAANDDIGFRCAR